MPLWMIWGPYLGCGKTAFLTYKAKEFYDAGWRVVSNYRLSFIDEEDYLPGLVIIQTDFKEKVFCAIDELWTLVDSRRAISGENRLLSTMLLSSRKRNKLIAGTAQQAHMLDKRYRDVADLRILCERRGKDRDLRAWIKWYAGAVELRAPGGMAILKGRFRVGDVAGLYDTSEVIENNPEILIKALSNWVKTLPYPNGSLLKELKMASNLTTKRHALQVYAHIERSMQDAILRELKVI